MKYTCKKIEPNSHEKQLRDLWLRNLEKAPPQRFEWIYRQANDIIDVHTWCLLKEQKLCGCLSLIGQLCYDSKGKKLRIGIFIDFMIDRGERTLFPAMLLVRYILKDARNYGFDYLFALPNSKARIVFNRCGLKMFDKVTRWAKILNFQPVVMKYLPNNILSKKISHLLETLVYSLSYFLSHYSYKNIEIYNGFPQPCQIESNISFGYCLNSKFIEWRYQNNPIVSYDFFVTKVNNDIITVVYRYEERKVFIDKLFFTDIANVSIALNIFSVKMKKCGIESISIEVAGNHLFRKQLKKSMFVLRPQNRLLLGTCLSGAIEPDELLMFDGDMDI